MFCNGALVWLLACATLLASGSAYPAAAAECAATQARYQYERRARPGPRAEKSKYPEPGTAAAQTYDTLRTAVMRVAPHAQKGSQELKRLTLRCWAMVHGLASLRIDRLIESGSDEGFVELADDLLGRVIDDAPAVAPTRGRGSRS